MAGHRLRANALLGGESMPTQVAAAPVSAPSADAGTPLSLAPAGLPAESDPQAGLMAALAAIPKKAEQSNAIQAPPLTINYPVPPGIARARAALAAANRRV